MLQPTVRADSVDQEWAQTRINMFLGDRHTAATRLQSFAHVFNARRDRAKLVSAMNVLQRSVLRYALTRRDARSQVLVTQTAITRIQVWSRTAVPRRQLAHHNALDLRQRTSASARQIQRVVRGRLQVTKSAVTRIQLWSRTTVPHRQLVVRNALTLRQHTSACQIQTVVRVYLHASQVVTLQRCARLIQSAARGVIARKQFRVLFERAHGAVRIQSIVRARFTRLRYVSLQPFLRLFHYSFTSEQVRFMLPMLGALSVDMMRDLTTAVFNKACIQPEFGDKFAYLCNCIDALHLSKVREFIINTVII